MDRVAISVVIEAQRDDASVTIVSMMAMETIRSTKITLIAIPASIM